MLGRYFWNILIAIDQLANTLLGGDPDETMSSRMGKMVRSWKQKPEHKGRFYIALTLCFLLNIIDKGHCEKSIEDDEGDRDIWRTV